MVSSRARGLIGPSTLASMCVFEHSSLNAKMPISKGDINMTMQWDPSLVVSLKFDPGASKWACIGMEREREKKKSVLLICNFGLGTSLWLFEHA